MGWIICRASVSVVGLSARAGHSSGVAPFPGVEDDSLVLLARGCVCVGILQGPDLLWGKFKDRVSFTDFPFSSESAGGVVFRTGVPPALLLLLCLTVRLKMEFLWIGM